MKITKKRRGNKIIFISAAGLLIGFLLVSYASNLPFVGKYLQANVAVYVKDSPEPVEPVPEPEPVIKHLARPEPLKAIYVSSWIAGTPSQMSRITAFVDRTEINAVVVDIKDATGQIAFKVNDPELQKENTDSKRIADIESVIKDLHERNIYVIGRVSTFQDPLFTKHHPELAVIRKSDGATWRDRKGLSWLDAGAPKTWDYIAAIAKESYARGFDEINFDYIRFPSDGDMENIAYRFYDSKKLTKPGQMKLFYQYIDKELSGGRGETSAVAGGLTSPNKNNDSQGLSSGKGGGESLVPYIPHSADLFGMTTTAEDDMGIGQMLADALPYFDYVYPMVYPSHYGAGINGYKNPATHPYEMVAYALKGAFDIASSTDSRQGESLPEGKGLPLSAVPPSYKKIVPWLQDFDIGTPYDASMVRAQIKATEDAGLTSWLLWDPGNHYTEAALKKD